MKGVRMHGVLPVLLCVMAAAPAAAQDHSGRGREATPRFVLGEGTAVFEVRHRGDGDFLIRLLDAGGGVVDELARGVGRYDGTKSVMIPRPGFYVFDGDASGEWRVRLREMHAANSDPAGPSGESGLADGRADGGTLGTRGWLGRGFLGGMLAGPFGMGLVMQRANESVTRDAQRAAAALDGNDFAYILAYRDGYAGVLRTRRQRSALLGGVVGTGVLALVIVQTINNLGASNDDTIIPETVVVPLLRWSH